MKDKLKAERSEIQLLDGTCICEIDAVGQKWSDDEDMAKALVTRYNSHDALVEDKKNLVEALKESMLDFVILAGNIRNANKVNNRWDGTPEIIDARIESIRATLASIKEAK